MSDEPESLTSANGDLIERVKTTDDLETLPYADRLPSVFTDGLSDGTIALIGGGLVLISAVRTMARSRRRAAMKAAIGGTLIALGRHQRRSSGDEHGHVHDDFETYDDTSEDLKHTSDDARAATERHGAGQRLEGDVGDERSGAVDPDEESPTADRAGQSHVTFTDEDGADEPRAKPELDADVEDPRRNTDDDVEIDVSESSIADEPGEATGPDPEQAQPAQTEDTEPERSPDEDASHVRSDRPDEHVRTDGSDEGDTSGSESGDRNEVGGENGSEESDEQLGQDETDVEPEEDGTESEDDEYDVDPQEEADEDAAEEHRP